jgi:hypothetical protein
MKRRAMLSPLLRGNRRSVLLRAGFLIATIAAVDWRLANDLPLGFFYLLPMLMVGGSCVLGKSLASLCFVLSSRNTSIN